MGPGLRPSEESCILTVLVERFKEATQRFESPIEVETKDSVAVTLLRTPLGGLL